MNSSAKNIYLTVILALVFFVTGRLAIPTLLYKLQMNILHIHLANMTLFVIIAVVSYRISKIVSYAAALYLLALLAISLFIALGYTNIMAKGFSQYNSKLKSAGIDSKVGYFINSSSRKILIRYMILKKWSR